MSKMSQCASRGLRASRLLAGCAIAALAIPAVAAWEPTAPVELVPKNGGLIFFDSMAIPADAANVANAHALTGSALVPTP